MKRSIYSLLISICIGLIKVSAQFPEVQHYGAPAAYPAAAKAVRAQGEVTISVEVNELGNVVEAKTINGHPLLRMISELAARKWKFQPAPGLHFMVIRIIYRPEPDSPREDPGLEILGPYRVRFTGDYTRIMSTVSN